MEYCSLRESQDQGMNNLYVCIVSLFAGFIYTVLM